MSLPAWALFVAAAVFAYSIAGYPLLLALLARIRRRPAPLAPFRPERVSVLVVAHGEAARLPGKVEELLAQRGPWGHLDITVALDGDGDRSAAALAPYLARGVAVRVLPGPRGKPTVLNEVVPTLAGQVVVLADARQSLPPETLAELIAPFADPGVGAVSGALVLRRGQDLGLGWYWRYERTLRRWEGRVHSVVGATGACYALRRALFRPLPPETIVDDLVLPLWVEAQGGRVVVAERALAYDDLGSLSHEFHRKTRTMAGNFQVLFHPGRMGRPFRPRIAWAYISHKALRLTWPLCALTLLGAAAAGRGPLFDVALGAQVVFYALALAGGLWPGARGRAGALEAPWTFVVLLAAVAMGFWRHVNGSARVTWRTGAPVD